MLQSVSSSITIAHWERFQGERRSQSKQLTVSRSAIDATATNSTHAVIPWIPQHTVNSEPFDKQAQATVGTST